MLFSWSASSSGFPRGGGGRDAGGEAAPANPTQTNPTLSGLLPQDSAAPSARCSQAPGTQRGARLRKRRRLLAGERGMTRRGKCGGRAGRRLGTPRATNTWCSPRLHKPSGTDGATPPRAVQQLPAAPRARGASGRCASRALALHGRSSFFPSFTFLCFSAKGAPARCKVLSPPERRHPRDGGENSRSALSQSATLPGGQTLRASPE